MTQGKDASLRSVQTISEKKIFRKPSKNLGVGKNHLQSGLILDFKPQSEYIEDHAIKRQVVPHSRHSFLFLVAIPQVHAEVV